VIHGEQVAGCVPRRDRDRGFPRERVLRQQVEEHLERAAERGAVDRGAHDDDVGAEHRGHRLLHGGRGGPPQQGVGRQRREIDQLGTRLARGERAQGGLQQQAAGGRRGEGTAGDSHCLQSNGQSLGHRSTSRKK